MPKKTWASAAIFTVMVCILNADVLNFISTVTKMLGDYTFPLDDSYIHLAISRNLSEHGVWGITRHEFSSTSSSPLFTVFIAILIKIFGNYDLIPVYFNLIAGNLLLLIFFMNFKNKPVQLLMIYLGFYFGVLLKIQIITGMEHILHILLISSCWIYFYRWFQTGFTHRKFQAAFLFTAALISLARYESMFFIMPVILFLIIHKRYAYAITAFVMAFLPIVIFGMYSISNGGHFFPNSLLVKGQHSLSLGGLYHSLVYAKDFILSDFYIYLIVMILVLLLNNYTINFRNYAAVAKEMYSTKLIYGIIFCALIAHLVFAKTGWLYRYDAYLIGLLIISIATAYGQIDSRKLNMSVVATAILMLFFTTTALRKRYIAAEYISLYATKNIHDQQIQMARFIHQYFNTSVITANDIGAVSYFSDIRLHDLVGLGSTDVLNRKMSDANIYTNYITNLNYDLMIVYDRWFSNIPFTNRIKVAELTITHNKICGDSKVSFYIPSNSSKKEYVYECLRKFKAQIPKDVMLTIYE